jgi:hypothetical protein
MAKGDGMNWKNWKDSRPLAGRQDEGGSPQIRISGSGVASVDGASILKSAAGKRQLEVLKSIKERRK